MKIDTIKIKMLMFDKGFNKGDLALAMQSSRQWLGTVLDRGHASMDYISKIAKALEVDPKEIVKLED